MRFIISLLFVIPPWVHGDTAVPTVTYSTFLHQNFTPKAIAADAAGSIYIAGDLLKDAVANQTTILMMKIDPRGGQYLYTRVVGGSSTESVNALTVDSKGNAYIAGSTASADFPVTEGGLLSDPPSGVNARRSFVTKLDANGLIVFSDLLGGKAASEALGIAITPNLRVLVTGRAMSGSGGSGFPTTPRAYAVSESSNHPYIVELDPTGRAMLFAATGIGGSSIALDAVGNIYVAGTTALLDYPTTPNAFQMTFPTFNVCSNPTCGIASQGPNQYVTKVDPSGARLIYSTAVSGTGSTTNAGLAVDSDGSAYVTGFAGSGYPYSTSAPSLPSGSQAVFAAPFLTKLDPLGQKLIFSIPVGGLGVQQSSVGKVYVSGAAGLNQLGSYAVPANLPALAAVPQSCLPIVTPQMLNSVQAIRSVAYVSMVEGSSGTILASQFIGGATASVSASTNDGTTVWIAGTASALDFPLTPASIGQSAAEVTTKNAYLTAVSFAPSPPTAERPQISCIVDAANLIPTSVVANQQLLTAFGSGLGPNDPASAIDFSSTNLGGVQINIGNQAAPILYASSTQVNFAVPTGTMQSVPMEFTFNGQTSSQRRLFVTSNRPSLFISIPDTYPSGGASPGQIAIAVNEDGTANSPSNPARLGTRISVFLNGLGSRPGGALQLFSSDGWSALTTQPVNPSVVQLELQLPSKLLNNFSCSTDLRLCKAVFTVYELANRGLTPLPGETTAYSVSGSVYLDGSFF